MKKQDVFDILNHLPDDIDPEQLMDEIILKAKLERSEEAIAAGEFESHEDVVKRTKEWSR